MIPAASAAARAAGVVVAAGYLLGVVDGPVIGVVGGLALVTFGRSLTLDRVHEVRFALALAILAGAIGAAVLRWGTLELNELRGVQAVLGPTLLVGPATTAAACIAAAVGGILALGAWMEEGSTEGLPLLEAGVGSAALTAAFWGPAPRGLHLGDLALTAGAILVTAGLAVGVALALRRVGPRLVWAAVGLAGATVAVAVGSLA
ncbi:MAG: hypothetical protein M3277_06280 [Actinomycetota bacterium]|nr:hypothetical protein [Actinomycetota bacterium]